MVILVHVCVMKIHIGNVINRPPRQNAPMFRVLTSFISKGIEWGCRKYMSTKIPPGIVHQGLLVPQGLYFDIMCPVCYDKLDAIFSL